MDPNSPAIITVPIGSITPIDQGPFGARELGAGDPNSSQLLATEFIVRFATPQSRVGTYSYAIGPTVQDLIRNMPNITEPNSGDTAALLLGTIGATDTTINVSGVGNFPIGLLPQAFVVQIGNEQMEVTNVNGTVWTVVRGFNGTTAVPHGSGAYVLSTTITVQDDIAYGISAPFVVQVDNEQMLVTGGTTPTSTGAFTFNVVRGYDNTLGVPHANGAEVIISGNMMDQNANSVTGEQNDGQTTLNSVTTIQQSGGVNDTILSSQGPGTTINEGGGISAVATTMSVGSNFNFPVTALPGAPFVVQVDNEQLEVTSVLTTTIDVPLVGIAATDTTITVASSAGFPPTPFDVQIGLEQVEVTNVAGTVWTVVRGIDGTVPAAYSNGATILGTVWNVVRGVNGTAAAAHANGSAVINYSATRNLDTTINEAGGMTAASGQLEVASNASFPVAGLPNTPFVVQVGSEQMRVTGILTTSISEAAGVTFGATTISVLPIAPPPTPFVVQIGSEQIEVTNVPTTALVGNITAGATTLTVTSSAPFPVTPFYVLIGAEQMQVTNVAGTTWTLIRGVNGTAAAAHSAAATVYGPNWTVVRGFNGTIPLNYPNRAVVYTPIWNITRGINGTAAASHANGAAVLSTSLNVASDSGFIQQLGGLPDTPFNVQIGAEQLRVTNVAGTTLGLLLRTRPSTSAGGLALPGRHDRLRGRQRRRSGHAIYRAGRFRIDPGHERRRHHVDDYARRQRDGRGQPRRWFARPEHDAGGFLERGLPGHAIRRPNRQRTGRAYQRFNRPRSTRRAS